MKKKLRIPKPRKTWRINPKTRVREDKKAYKRPKVKGEIREALEETYE